ncbi:spore germination protein [Alicyclobacillus contaminans]|uniref:spore germination protein n=1 Tax=Alicyclobacillus contaminans TaxID=392016 RepID=UPI00040C1E2A|nr:spore germination protein [Alicyclobacillus contaminans]
MFHKRKGKKMRHMSLSLESNSQYGSLGGAELGPDSPVPDTLSAMAQSIQEDWDRCADLQTRIVDVRGTKVLLVWIRGSVNLSRLELSVLTPLTEIYRERPRLEHIQWALRSCRLNPLRTRREVNQMIADGGVVLYVDGASVALSVDSGDAPGRSVDKAENEPTLYGPQEGFVESLDVNLALLRKRIRSPHLKVESRRVGEYSHSEVSIVYVDNIVKPQLVEEARRRISGLSVDTMSDIYKLMELVTDVPKTVFPMVEETERPDRVVGGLMQGRIALMVDGAPSCFMVPVQFVTLLASADDYYMNFILTLFIRLLRHMAFWLSLLLPSLYVALLTYNQDLMPTPLLISVASQHRGIPLPTVLEALVMMVSFELLREAGLRLPRAVGQSVSIVGTLIIGDAAVRAGLVSAGMVIVVAATGMASFALPVYGFVNPNRQLQYLFVLVAGLFGLVGIVTLGYLLVVHLVSLRSFGVPYMGPIAPLNFHDLKDTFVRAPWYAMDRRPEQMETVNPRRGRTRRPGPTKQSTGENP